MCVLIETLTVTTPERSWLEKLEEIRRVLRQSGYHFRSREEIDAQIQAERDEWEFSVLGTVSDRARPTPELAVEL